MLSVNDLFCDAASLCLCNSLRRHHLRSFLLDSVCYSFVTNYHRRVPCRNKYDRRSVPEPLVEQRSERFWGAKLLSSLYFAFTVITSSVSLESHIFSMNIYGHSTSKVYNVEIYKFMLNKTTKTRHSAQSIG
uniref:Uncharacterized protein n=1 Tax=Glyptapanteles flavicoxis TaxID=463051 RepID=B7S8M3_9HYME|nr:hypothetical protein GFP_L2_0220 [Glyptapanteles flavicoxis]